MLIGKVKKAKIAENGGLAKFECRRIFQGEMAEYLQAFPVGGFRIRSAVSFAKRAPPSRLVFALPEACKDRDCFVPDRAVSVEPLESWPQLFL